jgi:hypothetical protein
VSRIRGGRIRVKDKSGALFTVLRREQMETELGPARKLVWFELETGERVDAVDANTFLQTRTGKKLLRIRRVKEEARHKS